MYILYSNTRRLPWILTTLADQILKLGGASTEGIFRVPADLDEVMSMKSRFDQWESPMCQDCHTAASLLKLWLRELYEPLIPDQLYERYEVFRHYKFRIPNFRQADTSFPS